MLSSGHAIAISFAHVHQPTLISMQGYHVQERVVTCLAGHPNPRTRFFSWDGPIDVQSLRIESGRFISEVAAVEEGHRLHNNSPLAEKQYHDDCFANKSQNKKSRRR